MRSFVKEANNLSNSQKNPNIFEPKNEVCQRPLTESSTNFNVSIRKIIEKTTF